VRTKRDVETNALVTVLIESYTGTAITAQLADWQWQKLLFDHQPHVADMVLSAWALLPVKYSSTEYGVQVVPGAGYRYDMHTSTFDWGEHGTKLAFAALTNFKLQVQALEYLLQVHTVSFAPNLELTRIGSWKEQLHFWDWFWQPSEQKSSNQQSIYRIAMKHWLNRSPLKSC
jgi:hypothetical protein